MPTSTSDLSMITLVLNASLPVQLIMLLLVVLFFVAIRVHYE